MCWSTKFISGYTAGENGMRRTSGCMTGEAGREPAMLVG